MSPRPTRDMHSSLSLYSLGLMLLFVLACQPDAKQPEPEAAAAAATSSQADQASAASAEKPSVWKKLNKKIESAQEPQAASQLNHAEFKDFWTDFKQAVLRADQEAVAEMVHFPFTDGNDVYGEAHSLACENKAAFLRRYQAVFSPTVLAAIKANRYRGHQVFEEDTVEDTIGEHDFVLEVGFDERSRTRDLLFQRVDGHYKLVGLPYYP